MKKLNVVITSGGTTEHIDDVRTMSNISSGKLGARIADKFILDGHNVTYIAPKWSVMPSETNAGYMHLEVTNVESVMVAMSEYVPKAHVVIHPMAVSDFTFAYKGNVKCGSNSTEDFIKHMAKTIRATPKVISHFREWNAKAILVGFKFTSGKTEGELLSIAKTLRYTNNLDLVFANDMQLMIEAGNHVGMLIGTESVHRCYSKVEITDQIFADVMHISEFRFKAIS